ncbi:sulfatase [Fretibacter rubidus]|uniref:sulfatase family protein n=1 Tax=Fretibacter rubidus TaxID=570162 RepID=UPI00352AA790
MTLSTRRKFWSTKPKLFCGLALLVYLMSAACTAIQDKPESIYEDDRPNILWLVLEDASPTLAPYGDTTIDTPNINRLAEDGVTYTNVYSPSGVCSPSRASLALGMYPSAIGANHMRTSSHTDITGLPVYEAVPPPQAKMLSQYLRGHGYYTTNNYKTDYQFKTPKNAWDESGVFAHWRNRPQGKPFFSVVNFTTTHESGLFEPYGFRKIESRHYFSDDAERIAKLPTHPLDKTSEANTAIHLPKDTDFPIPSYLPDTPLVRRDMWKMYNNLAEADQQIGAVLAQLKEDGLLEKTVIFLYSDHGGPLPRQKRLIYDSGLKVPLIIRFPNAENSGDMDDQMVNFVDFAPATLSLAGLRTPDHMHGKDFILNDKDARKYIYAAADRFDGFTDTIRAVKEKRYKYIRNYRPEQEYYLPVTYREKIPTMQELLRLRDEGNLSSEQAQWFRESKEVDELYDTLADPHELNNLAQIPEYEEVLSRLKKEMDRWLNSIGDDPNRSELAMINTLWDGEISQPETAAPEVAIIDGMISLSSETHGASISYKIIQNNYEPAAWALYSEPFKATAGETLQIQAHRIGYHESKIKLHPIP